MKNSLIILCTFLLFSWNSFAGTDEPRVKVEPPCWWTGLGTDTLQLIVYGDDIASAEVSLKSDQMTIMEVHKAENPDYLFLDLKIFPGAKAGKYPLIFKKGRERIQVDYELLIRANQTDLYQGLNSSDAIYLLMPDRFANGSPANDNQEGMLENANRENPNGRHGGDIEGIRQHLGYMADMGFTALWINPVIENNRPAYSYHGYGITDFYQTDSRYGTNEEYRQLAQEAHDKGLKLIMDMVFNHCDTTQYTVADPPFADWVNQWETFTRSNFRGEVKADPYAANSDITRMSRGWFDTFMADLNQDNPFLMTYLIQNSIWWIEYLGLDAIRMDTYAYPEKGGMAKWAATIKRLYPNFTILGEVWLQKTAHTAYWQAREDNFDGYNSHIPVVTDFPLHYAVYQGLNENEGWTEGLRRMYYVLSEDFLYDDPMNLVVFPDNHDVSRYYTLVKENLDHYKLGLAFLLTVPRIPQIYYGTEILMTGEEHTGHGYIRQDFPGGWEGDTINAFTGEGLAADQLEAQAYLKKLLNWRRTNPVVQQGQFRHFIPENNTYVYFRYTDTGSLMVILNASDKLQTLQMERFREGWGGYSEGKDILTGKTHTLTTELTVPAKTPLILELKK
ncbi:MAG: glycoside hydrolase family 13 protein [Bacteroidales bacterium]|nr:glycoside hydrolase family 13 protein [Bacteroidales bacterium]